jgi:nucleoid DNA-binding protein
MEAKRYGKIDFINDILKDENVCEFNKSEILNFMHSFIFNFQQAIKNGYVVDLRGIGIFSIKKIRAREQAWNVNKGRILIKKIQNEPRKKFAPTNSVRFKPSKKLRKMLIETKLEPVIIN